MVTHQCNGVPAEAKAQEVEFWDNVLTGPPSQCWPWIGHYVSSQGYGLFYVKTPSGRKLLTAHRVAHFLRTGRDSTGLYACHKCDKRLCCNPSHVFLGTPAENSADMVAKGRKARSTGGGYRKLTYEQAIEIRALRASGMRRVDIARMFGVTGPAIGAVTSGKTLTAPYIKPPKLPPVPCFPDIQRKPRRAPGLCSMSTEQRSHVSALGLAAKRAKAERLLARTGK